MRLTELEQDWRRLCAKSHEPAARHSFEQHVAYLRDLAVAPDDIRFLVLSLAGHTQAIVPLEPARASFLGSPLKAWASPALPQWPAEVAIVAEATAGRAVVPLIANHLRRSHAGGSLLEVGPLPASSALWEGLRLMNHADYFVMSAKPGLAVDFSGSGDRKRRVGAVMGADAEAARQRLESLTAVEFRTSAEDADLATSLQAFVDLSTSSRSRMRASSSASSSSTPWSAPGLLAYCRSVSSATTGEITFEVDAAYLEGRCIAAHLCRRSSAEYTVVRAAYDQAYLPWQPGVVLLQRALERAFADSGVTHIRVAPDAAARCGSPTEVIGMEWAQVSVKRLSGRGLVFVRRLGARARRSLTNRAGR